MERHRGNVNAFYLVKETNLKKLRDILEEAKLWRH